MITYVINLPHRTDRLEDIQRELFVQKIEDYTVINPIEDKNSVVSLKNTVLTLLYEKSATAESNLLLLLEDDCEFINTSKIVRSITEAAVILDDIDSEWQMLYLGANVTVPLEKALPSSDTLFKLKSAYSTHAIVYNTRNLSKMLELIEPEIENDLPLDVIYVEKVQEKGHCYITGELFAVQRPGFSDIEGRRVNYAHLIQDRFKLNVKK